MSDEFTQRGGIALIYHAEYRCPAYRGSVSVTPYSAITSCSEVPGKVALSSDFGDRSSR
jgi:hypothetical protein